tara:strand:+ start:3500 stop:3946 length:447 start_codon:yes stop_codon:yes gene_type:complete
MKSLLIDPWKQKITEVKYSGDYKKIYDLISYDNDGLTEIPPVSTFGHVRLYANEDGVYIDDEGLYAPVQTFWMHKNYPQPLAGKALFLGCDDGGDSVSPLTSIETLRDDVKFIGTAASLSILHQAVKQEIEDYRPYFFDDTKEKRVHH